MPTRENTELDQLIEAVLAGAHQTKDNPTDFQGSDSAKRKAENVRKILRDRDIAFERVGFISFGGADGTELEYLLEHTPAPGGVLLELDNDLCDVARQKAEGLKSRHKEMRVLTGDALYLIDDAIGLLADWYRDNRIDLMVVTMHAILHEIFRRGHQRADMVDFLSKFTNAPLPSLLIVREPCLPQGLPQTVFLSANCSATNLGSVAKEIQRTHHSVFPNAPTIVRHKVRMDGRLAAETIWKLSYLDSFHYELEEITFSLTEDELLRDFAHAFGEESVRNEIFQSNSFDSSWNRNQIKLHDGNTELSKPKFHIQIIAAVSGTGFRARGEDAVAVEAHDPAAVAVGDRLHNLPALDTPLLGRDAQVADVAHRIRNGARMVTLTGAGGSGKTRLGLAIAAELTDDFAHGVWFVDLSALSDPTLVLGEIAATLGVRETKGLSLWESVKTFIASRQLLLVLDNLEQLLQDNEESPRTTQDIGKLLRTASKLAILATSRERLHVDREQVIEVEPFHVSEAIADLPQEDLAQVPAIALFSQRAQAVDEHFRLTPENAQAVVAICSRVDGLPLAIELAAARVKFLPPPALLAQLERRLPLLTGGNRDGKQIHQSMSETIAWSHDLLATPQRILFRRLSVFSGGATIEAVREVVDPDESLNVLHGLSSLVEQSLLKRIPGTDEDPHFFMLQTIGEYAHDQLELAQETVGVRKRHAAYFLERAEEAEIGLLGANQATWRQQLTLDRDNMRDALRFALEQQDGELANRLVGALGRYWSLEAVLDEGVEWLTAALEMRAGVSPYARARALGSRIRINPNIDQKVSDANELVEILRGGEINEEQRARLSLAVHTFPGEADLTYREEVELLSAASTSPLLSPEERNWALIFLGDKLRDDLQWEASLETLAGAYDLSKSLRNPVAQLGAAGALSYTHLLMGNWSESIRRSEEHRVLALQTSNEHERAPALKTLAWAYLYRGSLSAALEKANEALALAEERSETEDKIRIGRRRAEIYDGQRRWADSVPEYERLLAEDRKPGLKRSMSEGTTLSLLGISYLRQGDLSRAEQNLVESMPKHHPHSKPTALLALGDVRLRQGDIPAATECFTQAHALAEGRPYDQTKAMLGLLRAKAGVPLSIEDLQAAGRIEEEAGRNQHHDLLASHFLFLGQAAWDKDPTGHAGSEEALRCYQRCCAHALSYNRFLLDEVLEEGPALPVPPILAQCAARGDVGTGVLERLSAWWQSELGEDGKVLAQAEIAAREQEPGDESPQPSLVERIAAKLAARKQQDG